MEMLHPTMLKRLEEVFQGGLTSAVPSEFGCEMTLVRQTEGAEIEIPLLVGESGGVQVGVRKDRAVSGALIDTRVGSWSVLGVREDGAMLCTDGTTRAWLYLDREGTDFNDGRLERRTGTAMHETDRGAGV